MEGHFDPAWALGLVDPNANGQGSQGPVPVRVHLQQRHCETGDQNDNAYPSSHQAQQDSLAFLDDGPNGLHGLQGHNTVDAFQEPQGVKLDNVSYCAWDEAGCHTPSLCEALLQTDNFLQNFGFDDSPSSSIKTESEMEVSTSDNVTRSLNDLSKFSSAESLLSEKSPDPGSDGGAFAARDEGPLLEDLFRAVSGSGLSQEFAAPQKTKGPGSRAHATLSNKYATYSYRSGVASAPKSKRVSGSKPQNRYFAPGLDPIPENDVAQNGFSNGQPVSSAHMSTPVTVPKPVTSTYNISFPTSTTQFSKNGHRYDPWRTGGYNFQKSVSPGSLASPGSGYMYSCSSNSSPGSLASPFHGACQTSTTDLAEFQPLNFVHSDGTTTRYNLPSRNLSGEKVSNKASKRSYLGDGDKEDVSSDILNPISDSNEDDQGDGASFRQRKKSAPNPNDTKRKNFIKDGIDELQRMIPHFGMSKNEKVSQASVLSEAAKLIQSLRNGQDLLADQIQKVKCNIDELNKQIEVFQSQLPDTGAPYLPPRALASRPMESLFHDHVSDKTLDQWQYWIFTIILGHFVHSFEDQVSTNSMAELEATSQEWIANSMTLQQLRKDVYRKLAKLCVKTSIVDDPSKLPEEAIAYATHRMRGNRKKPWFTELPLT